MRSFCSAKALLIFSTKNISVFGYKVIKHLTSWPLNESVKLSMLWTTGPSILKPYYASTEDKLRNGHTVKINKVMMCLIEVFNYWHKLFSAITLWQQSTGEQLSSVNKWGIVNCTFCYAVDRSRGLLHTGQFRPKCNERHCNSAEVVFLNVSEFEKALTIYKPFCDRFVIQML